MSVFDDFVGLALKELFVGSQESLQAAHYSGGVMRVGGERLFPGGCLYFAIIIGK